MPYREPQLLFQEIDLNCRLNIAICLAFGICSLVICPLPANAQGTIETFSMPSSLVTESIWNGDRHKNMIALTFDDGPKPEFCQPILDILDQYGAKATFFVVGKEARDNPDLLMRMENSGHEIGNHTFSHTSVKDRPVGDALSDIQKCSEVIYNITGRQPKYFRPPGGGFNQALSKGLTRMGLRPVFWSLNAGDFIDITSGDEVPDDFQKMADALSKKIIDNAQPGDVILLHNGSEQTVRALPVILKGLKAKGYSFVTISELIGENN